MGESLPFFAFMPMYFSSINYWVNADRRKIMEHYILGDLLGIPEIGGPFRFYDEYLLVDEIDSNEDVGVLVEFYEFLLVFTFLVYFFRRQNIFFKYLVSLKDYFTVAFESPTLMLNSIPFFKELIVSLGFPIKPLDYSGLASLCLDFYWSVFCDLKKTFNLKEKKRLEIFFFVPFNFFRLYTCPGFFGGLYSNCLPFINDIFFQYFFFEKKCHFLVYHGDIDNTYVSCSENVRKWESFVVRFTRVIMMLLPPFIVIFEVFLNITDELVLIRWAEMSSFATNAFFDDPMVTILFFQYIPPFFSENLISNHCYNLSLVADSFSKDKYNTFYFFLFFSFLTVHKSLFIDDIKFNKNA